MLKMQIFYENNNTILRRVSCFDIRLTLDCGQAFRWHEAAPGLWHGVAGGVPLSLSQEGDCVTLYQTSPDAYEKNWKKYFDFDRDYDAILEGFLSDSLLRETIKQYYGIRILRQDSWEALFSFVFSSSNHIKRIRGFLEKICAAYGEELADGSFAFPSAAILATVPEGDFRRLGAGYRAPFLVDCAVKVARGEIKFNDIKSMPLADARQTLMQIQGVGPKVAECALLFGFGRMDAFPVDRWIKRVLELYPDGLPACFLGYEGIAQQYMFHYARMHLGSK